MNRLKQAAELILEEWREQLKAGDILYQDEVAALYSIMGDVNDYLTPYYEEGVLKRKGGNK